MLDEVPGLSSIKELVSSSNGFEFAGAKLMLGWPGSDQKYLGGNMKHVFPGTIEGTPVVFWCASEKYKNIPEGQFVSGEMLTRASLEYAKQLGMQLPPHPTNQRELTSAIGFTEVTRTKRRSPFYFGSFEAEGNQFHVVERAPQDIGKTNIPMQDSLDKPMYPRIARALAKAMEYFETINTVGFVGGDLNLSKLDRIRLELGETQDKDVVMVIDNDLDVPKTAERTVSEQSMKLGLLCCQALTSVALDQADNQYSTERAHVLVQALKRSSAQLSIIPEPTRLFFRELLGDYETYGWKNPVDLKNDLRLFGELIETYQRKDWNRLEGTMSDAANRSSQSRTSLLLAKLGARLLLHGVNTGLVTEHELGETYLGALNLVKEHIPQAITDAFGRIRVELMRIPDFGKADDALTAFERQGFVERAGPLTEVYIFCKRYVAAFRDLNRNALLNIYESFGPFLPDASGKEFQPDAMHVSMMQQFRQRFPEESIEGTKARQTFFGWLSSYKDMRAALAEPLRNAVHRQELVRRVEGWKTLHGTTPGQTAEELLTRLTEKVERSEKDELTTFVGLEKRVAHLIEIVGEKDAQIAAMLEELKQLRAEHIVLRAELARAQMTVQTQAEPKPMGTVPPHKPTEALRTAGAKVRQEFYGRGEPEPVSKTPGEEEPLIVNNYLTHTTADIKVLFAQIGNDFQTLFKQDSLPSEIRSELTEVLHQADFSQYTVVQLLNTGRVNPRRIRKWLEILAAEDPDRYSSLREKLGVFIDKNV